MQSLNKDYKFVCYKSVCVQEPILIPICWAAVTLYQRAWHCSATILWNTARF